MNLRVTTGNVAGASADLLVLPLFDSDVQPKAKHALLSELDGALDGALLETARAEGFAARAEQSFVFHTHKKLAAERVMLVGLGKKEKFNAEALRLATGRVIKAANRIRVGTVALVLPDAPAESPAELARAAAEGALLGAYKFDRYRTTNAEEKKARKVGQVTLLAPGAKNAKELEAGVALGRTVSEAVNFARDLVNEPAGVLTPTKLAEEAKALGKRAGLKVEVRGRKEIQALKMGMFLGVAQGSVEEPKLVHISYVPKNPKHAKVAPVALVGKAITFDSGGLSLKTSDGMMDMKTDMAGSAAVLGAMAVVAELAPPFPVHGFFGACENMPSGTSYKLGDVLHSRLGKTVEITNTDAEGRLVLGDVLAWANEHKPAVLIDIATLTGACMVALGHYMAGAFGVDEALMGEVLQAGKAAGEELWRMPISELQKDALRSEIADMKNTGERYAGATNAAIFLKEFVGETPWVHLDIAGPSQSPKERGYHSKGATGFGVRTFVELIRARSER